MFISADHDPGYIGVDQTGGGGMSFECHHVPGLCRAGTLLYPTRAGTMIPSWKVSWKSAFARSGQKGHGSIWNVSVGPPAGGKEIFITLRMNDIHEAQDLDGWNIPQFKRENLDKSRGPGRGYQQNVGLVFLFLRLFPS